MEGSEHYLYCERERRRKGKKVFYFLVCLEKPLRRHLKKFRNSVCVTPCKWFSFGALRGHATNQHVVPTSLCYNLKWKLFPNWKQDLFLARAFCFTPKISHLPPDSFHASSHRSILNSSLSNVLRVLARQCCSNINQTLLMFCTFTLLMFLSCSSTAMSLYR